MSLKGCVKYVRCSLETDDKSFLPERIRRLTSKSKSTVLVLSTQTSKKYSVYLLLRNFLAFLALLRLCLFHPYVSVPDFSADFFFSPDVIKFRGTFHPSKCFAEAVAPK